MILIVAENIDPHADAVAEILNRGGVDFARIDLDSVHHDFDVVIRSIGGRPHWVLVDRETKQSVSADQIGAVWWRRGANFCLEPKLIPEDSLNNEETKGVTKWLIESLPDSLFPLGHPCAFNKAANKVRQLACAVQAGLNVPDYVFSNSWSELFDFSQGKSLVIKSLVLSAARKLDGEYLFFCRRLESGEIREQVGRDVSGFLQREVERSRDLRVFVGPGWTHCCEINLAQMPGEDVDWREHVDRLDHQACILSESLEVGCRKYLDLMGLKSGHFDFILGDDGQAWFLECNPNGQWYWLELIGGCAIAADVSQTLVECDRKWRSDRV